MGAELIHVLLRMDGAGRPIRDSAETRTQVGNRDHKVRARPTIPANHQSLRLEVFMEFPPGHAPRSTWNEIRPTARHSSTRADS